VGAPQLERSASAGGVVAGRKLKKLMAHDDQEGYTGKSGDNLEAEGKKLQQLFGSVKRENLKRLQCGIVKDRPFRMPTPAAPKRLGTGPGNG